MTEEKKLNKKTESDVLWDEISNREISLFGMTPVKVSECVKRITTSPDELTLSLKYPAVLAALDDALNVQRSPTSEKRVELYKLDQTNNGFIIITRENGSKK